MGLLSNIDDTLAKSDNTVGILSELSLLPNSEHSFSLFKKTYLDAKKIWLYEYRFECPNILKKLNDAVNNKISDFNGFEITVAVCCNEINPDYYASVRNHNQARVTYTLEITTKRGPHLTLNQYESTYAPRLNDELLADSLFRIQLCCISTIFTNVDSIYDYLSTTNYFRGYNLYRFTQI